MSERVNACDLYLNGCMKLLFPGANRAVESPVTDCNNKRDREG